MSRCRERGSTIGSTAWEIACGDEHIYTPENFVHITMNKSLAQAGILAGSAEAGEEVIQMKPQRVNMRLRVSK